MKRIQDLSVLFLIPTCESTVMSSFKKKKLNKASLPWNTWFSVFSFYLDVSSVIIFYRNYLF